MIHFFRSVKVLWKLKLIELRVHNTENLKFKIESQVNLPLQIIVKRI